jgi:hypothetical protein
MHNNNPTVNIQRNADTSRFNKRIGSVVYQVSVNFKEDAIETMDTKLKRLIKRELEAVS